MKPWSEEDKQYLIESWGNKSVPAIARKLGRTNSAVMLKAGRMKLGASVRSSDMITLLELLNTVGIGRGAYSFYFERFKKHGLPIHHHRVINKRIRMVDIDEFWVFAEKHKQFFDFSRFEENALGIEPAWVKEKRKEDTKRIIGLHTHKSRWTSEEDAELTRLVNTFRYSYTEIAARLKRTEGSVARRITDLGLKARPLKADNHIEWTSQQLEILCDMIKKGSNYECIATCIGKSTKAVRGKVFTTYLTENLNKVTMLLGDGEWGDNRPERKLRQRLLMTVEEKKELKDGVSALASVLLYRIRTHYDNQDNWQRNLCQHWHPKYGCEKDVLNCDECAFFERMREQHCVRCGGTFFEREESRVCAPCREQRKKAAYKKYLVMEEKRRRSNV